MEGPESEEECKKRQKDVEGHKNPTRQSVKQKLKMEIGYIRYRVANQLASSNPSLKLDDQRLSNILSTLNTPTHPPYALMINSAIAELNKDGGTSESGISAFIAKTYENLPLAHEAILKHHLRILCERREVVCTDDELYILLANSEAENGALKAKPGKTRKRGRERGIGIGGPSKSKRKNGGGEENQLVVVESEDVMEAVEDQSETGTKSDKRVLSEAGDEAGRNSNEGVQEVMEVAQGKQLGIDSEESEPHSVQTELSEKQLQLEDAEPSGNSQQRVKPAKSKKPPLSQQRKPNVQAEIQLRKLRSYSRQSAESDTDELPLPAHQAKHQEEEEEEDQLMVLESEGVIEAVEDQSKRAGTKSENRVLNLNEGAKEVIKEAQAKQVGIVSEEREPRSVQTELSENQLELEAAEPSSEGKQRVKPAKSKKPSLSQANIQAEIQRRKLRSYSRHSAESDTDGTTPELPLPAHPAKHQEEKEAYKLCRGIETSLETESPQSLKRCGEKESSLSRPLPRRTLRSNSKMPPISEPSAPTLTLSIVLSEDLPRDQDEPPNPKPDTALAVSNPPRKKRGRPRRDNAPTALALPPPKRRGRGRPRKLRPEEDSEAGAELALAQPPPKRRGRGRSRKLRPEEDSETGAELALALPPPKRRGRGRSRKLRPEENSEAGAELALATPPVKRRGRGRPRKLRPEEDSEADAELALALLPPKRRGRGRPRKALENAMMPLAVFRPGLDDDHNDR